MACWYALYFLFSATLVPVISVRNDPQSVLAEQWREDIRIAAQLIRDMEGLGLSTFAARYSQTLERLVHNYVILGTPSQNDTSTSTAEHCTEPVDETPAEQMQSIHSMLWPENELGLVDQYL
jgi:hypothetical protein